MPPNDLAEEAILDRIEDALERAVKEDPELDWEYGSKVKKQKYTDLALDQFTSDAATPPVTRSWFKYGRAAPAAPSGSNRVGVMDSTLTTGVDTPQIVTMAEEDLVHFFKHQVGDPKLNRRNWFAKDLNFLKLYYRHHAPDWLRPIYLTNIELRFLFWNVKSDIQNLLSGQAGGATSLAMFGGGSQTVDYYEQAGRLAAELQIELAKHEVFEPALQTLTAYTDLLEDVLMTLAEIPSDELNQGHADIIRELQTFYDEEAWEHVAFIMSRETVEGPNSSKIRELSNTNLTQIAEQFPSKLDVLRSSCAEVGLTPTVATTPTHDDETADIIDDTIGAVDGDRG
jgi:hypothetical protein